MVVGSGTGGPDRDRDGLLQRVARAVSRSNGYVAVLVDGGMTVKWASETVEALLGRDDVVGMNVLGLIHPDDVELALLGIMHHTANAEAYAALDRSAPVDPVTVRLQHADESWVQVQVTLVNHLADPEIDGLFAICHVVVDRSDMELAIDLMSRNAPVEEVLAVVARFVERTGPGQRCQFVWWRDGVRRVVTADGAVLPAPPAALVDETRATGDAQQLTASEATPEQRTTFSEDRVVVWTAPVLAPEGRDVLGVMVVWRDVEFDLVLKQADHPALRLASLALVDDRYKSVLRWEASHDSLTQVHNRSGFAAALSATEGPCAVLYLDLDDFKPVNDRFGHEGGDRVLVRAAERIRRSVRDVDVVARMGGDEFAVICPDVTPETAVEIARRVSRAVCRPVRLSGETVKVGVSVGIASARRPGERTSLLRRADEALYLAKDGGKRRIAVEQHLGGSHSR